MRGSRNFHEGGPTKMVIFGHRRGGSYPPKKSRNYPLLGKIFKFQRGGGVPPLDPRMAAHSACDMFHGISIVSLVFSHLGSFSDCAFS